MEVLIRLAFAVVLLWVTLAVALSYLAGPTGFLKKAGAWKIGSWTIRSLWRGLAGLVRLAIRGRRPRFRRAHSQTPSGFFR